MKFFFQKVRRFFKRRPKPKFEIGQYALILPPPGTSQPITRYTIVRSRRWSESDWLWVYSGPVIVCMVDREGRARNYIRHYVKTLTENQLDEVRGGAQGLM